jgi:RNA polymerase sigma-70 factor (ECF subfamily)
MTSSCQWTDQRLIEAMRGGDRDRNLALTHLYEKSELYSITYSIVVKNSNGTEEDVRDVYNESFCALSRELENGRFKGKSKLSTYYYRIALRTWLVFKRKKAAAAPQGIDDLPEEEYDPNETYYTKEEQKHALANAIQKLGRRSQQILNLWANDFSMKEIASIIELGNSDRAKKETQRCKNRLRKIVNEDPILSKQLLTVYNCN